jgi:DNA-binding NarL/FixJ family response regulator
MRILLATGETDLRLSMELLLSEQPGINILGTASDTAGLIALVESTCPDLALLDWDLPGRPVEEVLSHIQLFEVPPKLIVLGVNPESKKAALQASADAYVDKGDPPKNLLAALEHLNSTSDKKFS